MRWLELTVTTALQSSEAVAARLLESGAGGVSFEEHWDWEKAARDGLGDIFPATSKQEKNIVIIRGYLPLSFLNKSKAARLGESLADLPDFGLQPAKLCCCEVDDSLWEDAWKKYWQPTEVGQRLLIVPSWHQVPPSSRLVLLLDPGPAFGTGTHESTRLCLELLETQINGSETVLDLGCGSGILSLAARLLGAGSVYGLDKDETAVRFSRMNARNNAMEEVKFVTADLNETGSWPILPAANLILANLTADLLLLLREDISGLLMPGGRIILSGIIRERKVEVITAFGQAGFGLTEELSAGEWSALLLELIS